MSGVNLQDKQKEITFFDAHAASAEYDVFTPQSNSRLIAAFVRLSELPRGSRVADLGCGSGVFTDLLRHEGYASVGIDISGKLVALGRSKSRVDQRRRGKPSFRLREPGWGAAQWLAAPFSGPETAYRRGTPCAQAWWPRFVGFDPNRMNPFMWLYRDRASPFYSPTGVTENERPILAWRVSALFRDQSFDVRTDYLAGKAYRYIVSQRTRALLPIYNFIDKVAFNTAMMRPFRPFVLMSGEKFQ